MKEQITIKIDKESLEEHVKRICRSNLKKPAFICTKCPILGPVIDVMKKYEWRYNEEAMKKPIADYYSIHSYRINTNHNSYKKK